MTNTNPLATLGLSLSRGGAVALGAAIERGPRYGRSRFDADRPGTTAAQFAYQGGGASMADLAIEHALAG